MPPLRKNNKRMGAIPTDINPTGAFARSQWASMKKNPANGKKFNVNINSRRKKSSREQFKSYPKSC